MGLQKYKRTQWDDDALPFFSDGCVCIFVIFARWVYKNTNARNETTMRCFFIRWMRLYLCDIFARWAYKNANARNDTTMQSTESPIFDASFWSENGVSCPQCGHERNKIGDSVLWFGRFVKRQVCVQNRGELPTAEATHRRVTRVSSRAFVSL